MIIANPLYDVVFKRLMENERVAKFFIGTLLEQTIETIQVKPQEYTYEGEFDFSDPKDLEVYENRIRERRTIWIYRLDFIATIRTGTGEFKKVLIEIQKAKNEVDVMRFRNYLAEQYKREDVVNNKKMVLPITTIYVLGFELPEIQTPCIRVDRNYKDLINKTTLTAKSDFVEKLTHDSYVVQVKRITGRYQTRLDKLLSVFEQTNFLDDKKIIKEFSHSTDIEEVKIMTDILHHSGTNPEEKKKIEAEQEALRTINALLAERDNELEENRKALEENRKALEENRKTLSEKDKALNEKDQTISEKDQALSEMKKQLEELQRKLRKKE
jgi:hypothetical protein